ncbi:MAG: hypothetical protein HY700_11225 [Gemmatimonadetes bacterium]|nr:hypothetical protein [Gemmatimonadota bacterium]
MTCYYCNRENQQIPDGGNCSACQVHVCTSPSRRPDGRFHGDRCNCGCRRLFCDPDLEPHAIDEHGGTVATCFPNFSLQLAVPAFAAASKGISTLQRAPQEDSQINHFLNSVTPGWRALRTATENMVDAAGIVGPAPRPFDRWHVRLKPEFLTAGTMERVAVLAARAMGEAWSAADKKSRSAKLKMGSPFHTLEKFAAWSNKAEPLTPTAIDPWLGGIQLRGGFDFEIPTESGPPLMHALSNVEVPRTSQAVAEWLVAGLVHRSTAADEVVAY